MNATATRHDRRMHALMNNPAGKVLHATAARRRTAVAAHVLLTVALVWLLILLYAHDQVWAAFAMLGVLLLWCIATGVLNGATRGLFELRSRVLDERQLMERDRARGIAHKMTGALVFGAAAGLWLTAVLTDGQLSRAYVAPLLAGVFVLHWLMPLWVAGLLVQDEPADDLDELDGLDDLDGLGTHGLAGPHPGMPGARA
ncbi:hypothetical protein [Streptomyces sp. NPDC058657]|uniref:hypothetical protein n=1 Tax=unclassified Streptomyces TaxID=2593676 RepID=UPI00366140B2